MKSVFLLIVFIIPVFSFSQNNYIVKTEDGRRVLLKADFTWEYIDLEASQGVSLIDTVAKSKIEDGCKLGTDFQEPTLNKKIQDQLKKGRATMGHVKKKVAKDNNCTVEDVILLSAREKKSDGQYVFCVKGKNVSYKRVGNNIIKKNKFF